MSPIDPDGRRGAPGVIDEQTYAWFVDLGRRAPTAEPGRRWCASPTGACSKRGARRLGARASSMRSATKETRVRRLAGGGAGVPADLPIRDLGSRSAAGSPFRTSSVPERSGAPPRASTRLAAYASEPRISHAGWFAPCRAARPLASLKVENVKSFSSCLGDIMIKSELVKRLAEQKSASVQRDVENIVNPNPRQTNRRRTPRGDPDRAARLRRVLPVKRRDARVGRNPRTRRDRRGRREGDPRLQDRQGDAPAPQSRGRPDEPESADGPGNGSERGAPSPGALRSPQAGLVARRTSPMPRIVTLVILVPLALIVPPPPQSRLSSPWRTACRR